MNDSLRSWGWSSYFESRFAALGRGDLVPGRVIEARRGLLRLQTAAGPVAATVSGRRYHEAAGAAELPVVGDWVTCAPPPGDGPAVIHELLERRNRLSRKAAGAGAVEQVVAANVDLVLLVMGLDGDYNPRRLERFLAMAEESGARPAVVLNKVDLCAELERRLDQTRGLCAGTPVVAISALAGELDPLELLLEPRATVAFVGSSGAGKSTIINRLLGREVLATRPVRARDSRGVHTTSHRELFRLPGGCLVIDNPGVREIQPWSTDQALPRVFEDVERMAAGCRFADCTHRSEPGCAVRAAIESGELDPGRLANLRRLEQEAAALELRKDVRARRAAERRQGKLYKSIQRHKRDRQR